mmetsp:Transcript_30483/g.78842  ORF Transcript_30483/g.78842 Transcript_30483/m.78842 type:complete len:248 (+) Transcript_30483:1316-2059(+)
MISMSNDAQNTGLTLSVIPLRIRNNSRNTRSNRTILSIRKSRKTRNTANFFNAPPPPAAASTQTSNTERFTKKKIQHIPPGSKIRPPKIVEFHQHLQEEDRTPQILHHRPENLGARVVHGNPHGDRVDADGQVAGDHEPPCCTDHGPPLGQLLLVVRAHGLLHNGEPVVISLEPLPEHRRYRLVALLLGLGVAGRRREAGEGVQLLSGPHSRHRQIRRTDTRRIRTRARHLPGGLPRDVDRTHTLQI